MVGLLGPSAPSAQVLWTARLQGDPVGAYSEDSAKLDFGPNLKYAKVLPGRAEIKIDAELGKRVLQVKYPKGCVGPDDCAMQVRAYFPPQDSAWMRFKVRFETGFDWNKGGKLPGMCGGLCNTGCVSVTGEDGWSAREMWQPAGKMIQYLYYPGKSNSCGDDFPWSSLQLVPGKWYEVVDQIVLNTPVPLGGTGKKDGIIRSWLDGKLVFEKTDVRFRDIATVKLDEFYFSTFHGGSDASWAPSHDSYASFSDMMVSIINPNLIPTEIMNPSGPRQANGNAASGLEAPECRVDGNVLRITHRNSAGLNFQLIDLRGAEVTAFSAPEPGEHAYALNLRPGVYFLRWSAPDAGTQGAPAHFSYSASKIKIAIFGQK